MERRLAAILAADVAGYSRLMHDDENATLEAWWSARKDIVDPLIAEHQGRIVKHTGDGFLAEFGTALNAMNCAATIQKKMNERDRSLAEDRRLRFRIGINLADIVDDSEDIHGDGVNIAARLEGIAEPGGICITGDVYNQVHRKAGLAFEDIGEHEVKNIERPIHVYRVDMGDGAVAASDGGRFAMPGWVIAAAVVVVVAGGLLVWKSAIEKGDEATMAEDAKTPAVAAPEPATAPAAKPTIAVLPFTNFSDDKAQEYFSDGLTEDLITDISKVSGILVISRNSTFSFKGQSPDVREVGKTLGATHVVEGSVRKAGNTIRISVQLIDASDGRHIWAERYDRELKDIFAIQDEVVGKIVTLLSLKLTPDEKVRISRKGTSNLEAYDLYMKGREQESFFNREANVEAKEFYERALSLDPNYAEAYAGLSRIYALDAQFGWVENAERGYLKSLELAEKSVELNEDLPLAHFALGRTLVRPGISQHGRAIKELEKAIALDPNYADGYGYLGMQYVQTGNPGRGLDLIGKAMRINPIFPFWYFYVKGAAQYMLEDYDGAAENLGMAVERNLTVFFNHYWLAAALAQAGRQEDAEWQVEELYGMGFELTLDGIMAQTPVRDSASRDRFLEGLRKAGFK